MKTYTLLPKFLLRTPALPFSPLWENAEPLRDPAQCTARLQEVFTQAPVQEALFLASPDLHQRCLEWLAGTIESAEDCRKIECRLWSYYLRMSTRCTPFGLFAGCTMGKWGENTQVELAPLAQQGRNTRLDMHYLCALAQHLEAQAFIRPYLKFFPNSSMYLFADKIRYIEYRYQDGHRSHQISAVEATPYLQQVLKTAENGAYLRQLAQPLQDEETDFDEALQFVEQVVDTQLLVSELEPAITGDDLLAQMLGILRGIQGEHPGEGLQQIIDVLSKVQALLAGLDRQAYDDNLSIYKMIAAELDILGVPYEMKMLFQADMVRRPVHAQLQNRLAGSIRRALEALNRLQPRPAIRSNLQAFQDAFFQRYETRDIPLLEALDNESGIGYLQDAGPGDVSPMIDDIQLPPGRPSAPSFSLDPRESFLLKKLIRASREGAYAVELSDEELQVFEPDWDRTPDTLSVTGSVIAAAGDGPEQVFIRFAGGSSAANLLGRFTHADPAIDRFTRDIAEREQALHPELVFAEIVHLPEDRIGNILMRTQLRPYEIPFLARASVPAEQQVRLQDLYLSVRNERLVLYSKKLNKKIVPRLSTAHNYSMNALPIYQFLCDLQVQAISPSLGFFWGPLEAQFTFLPQVRYKNCILSRACWHLEKKQFEALLKAVPPNREQALRDWREKWNIPARFLIADGDNELFIDLENAACADLFLMELKKRETISLLEFLFEPKTAIVRDEIGGRYTNEFIMAFARLEAPIRPEASGQSAIRNPQSAIRSFAPGSEWLYYQIFLGAQSADQLLAQVIRPLVETLQSEGLIDRWFFIRYSEDGLHLRLRLHLPDTAQIGAVLQLVASHTDPALQGGLIWKIRTDTYQREVERYGASTMELSEQLFCIDSHFTLRLLELAGGYEEAELLRWFYAMLSIDGLLDAFQYELPAKMQLLEQLKTGFAREFAADNAEGTKQLSAKYRQHREVIEELLLQPEKREAHFSEEILNLLAERAAALEPVGRVILDIRERGGMEVDLNSYLASQIHMLMNRLFRSQQRKYELVVYDLLFRGYYTGVMRRKHGAEKG